MVVLLRATRGGGGPGHARICPTVGGIGVDADWGAVDGMHIGATW